MSWVFVFLCTAMVVLWYVAMVICCIAMAIFVVAYCHVCLCCGILPWLFLRDKEKESKHEEESSENIVYQGQHGKRSKQEQISVNNQQQHQQTQQQQKQQQSRLKHAR